eukprot:COSAG01_NODE_1416_length_10373_cov_4.944984_7_plen_152_part_00
MPTRRTSASPCRCVQIDYQRRRKIDYQRRATVTPVLLPVGRARARQANQSNAKVKIGKHDCVAPHTASWCETEPRRVRRRRRLLLTPHSCASRSMAYIEIGSREQQLDVVRATFLFNRLDPFDERVQCHTTGVAHDLAVAAVAAMASSALR